MKRRLIALIIFSIAMAVVESSLVVYVRELYYPSGSYFPLNIATPPRIVLMELFREFATIVMLISIAYLMSNSFIKRFAYFLIAFGIWDLAYYLWLKVFTNWPNSLLDWDLLFLIPVPWIGPVISPILCALSMVLFGFILSYLVEDKGLNVSFTTLDWFLIIFGSIIIILSFSLDILNIIISKGFYKNYFSLLKNTDFLNEINSYIPKNFHWFYYLIGLILVYIGFLRALLSNIIK